jgi:type II secretory pathway component GspD/PulD (secretin)
MSKFVVFLALSFFLIAVPLDFPAQVSAVSYAQPQASDEQPLITNVFYETDVKEALSAISAQTGINIVADQTVYGFLSLELVDVPFEEALRRVLSPFGLTFRKMPGYYLVGAAYPDNPSFGLLSVTARIVPNYLKAQDVPLLLSKFFEPFIKVDADANILTVTASPEIVQRVKQELATIDVPPRQVMVEALVTEFSNEAKKSLGIDAGFIGGKGAGDTLSIFAPVGDLLDNTLGIGIFKPNAEAHGWRGQFSATLRALVQDGKVNIRANPRVATVEGQKAHIVIGKEQYYVILTGTAPYSYGQLERIPFGVSLDIVPYVSDDGEITVELQPEVSDVVGLGATGLPVVSRRSVSTKVRVKDGETIVIGGLLQKNETTTRRKIPLLGDIPILGLLFSRTDRQVNEVETVIFLTPHLLTQGTGASGE